MLLEGLIINWRHVKGHQTGEDIDIWGHLNNLADKLAGEHRTDPQAATPPSDIKIPGEKWQLMIRDRKIHKTIQTSLHQEMSRYTIFPYWIKKERVSVEGIDKVNWAALGAAFHVLNGFS
jgi:hypothetical protein